MVWLVLGMGVDVGMRFRWKSADGVVEFWEFGGVEIEISTDQVMLTELTEAKPGI